MFVLFMLSEGIKSGFDPIIHGKSLLGPSCVPGWWNCTLHVLPLMLLSDFGDL